MKHRNSFLLFLIIICLCVLIFYQALITLILPLRFNVTILLIECFLLFFFLFRLLWPY